MRASRTSRSARPRRGVAATIGDALLWIAAVAGVGCIALVIAASFFHVTLIMFKTGSMTPTIPAGAVALVREIPASDISIGDVVTVDRAGLLPITHRVTSISPVDAGAVSITMKGDANADADPAPYVVERVRLVVASVPYLATIVVALGHPLVMGGITIAAGLLVTWAFWPREQSPASSRSRRQRRRARESAALPKGAHRDGTGAPEGERTARAGTATVMSTLVVVAVVGIPLFAPSDAARAAETDTIVAGQYLTLTSIGDPDQLSALTPGRPVGWQIGVSTDAPSSGLIHIGISSSGSMARPGGLMIDVRSCDVRWVNNVCPTGFSWWLTEQGLAGATIPTAPNGSREMTTIRSTTVVWILVRATMPAGMPPGATANVRISAWGVGDDVSIGAPGNLLAPTGVSIDFAVALALGSIGTGILIAVIAGVLRRRRTREETQGDLQ